MPQIPELPTFDGLRTRIEEAKRFHGGAMPNALACGWSGYLAALIEWGLITVHDHDRLLDLLPNVEGENPAVKILLGHDGTA